MKSFVLLAITLLIGPLSFAETATGDSCYSAGDARKEAIFEAKKYCFGATGKSGIEILGNAIVEPGDGCYENFIVKPKYVGPSTKVTLYFVCASESK